LLDMRRCEAVGVPLAGVKETASREAQASVLAVARRAIVACALGVPRTFRSLGMAAKCLKRMERPKGFEPLTPRFVVLVS